MLRDVRIAFDDWQATREKFKGWRRITEELCRIIGDVFGYIFTYHSNGSDTRGTGRSITFHCSQHMNKRKQWKVDDVSKQRQCKGEEKFPCQGRIHFTVVSEEGSVKLSHSMVPLGPFDIIVHFHHDVYHQLCQRQPFPPEVRQYIQKHFKSTSSEMYQELLAARACGELHNDLKALTDHNIRYW